MKETVDERGHCIDGAKKFLISMERQVGPTTPQREMHGVVGRPFLRSRFIYLATCGRRERIFRQGPRCPTRLRSCSPFPNIVTKEPFREEGFLQARKLPEDGVVMSVKRTSLIPWTKEAPRPRVPSSSEKIPVLNQTLAVFLHKRGPLLTAHCEHKPPCILC